MNISKSLPKTLPQSKDAKSVEKPKQQAEAIKVNEDKVDIQGGHSEKDWTVLVWANGKADGADRIVPSVVRELEMAGSDENMDIVAQVGRKSRVYDKITKDWSGVRRYHIERNENPASAQKELMAWFIPPYTDGIVSPVLEDMGNLDMGSSANLSEFLQWGMKEYPAKNFALVINGEAGGIAGAGLDEEFGQRLTGEGISQALREAKSATGEDVNLVAFDGSYMGGIETAHQLKDVAEIMVASEGAVSLGSIQLDMVMKDLKFELAEKGEVTPEQLAKWFLFETSANPGPMAELVNPTLSAIDLKKIDGVKDAYGKVAQELAKALKDQPDAKEALRDTIGLTQAYATNEDSDDFYGDFRDIGHFAKNLKAEKRFGEAIHKAAGKLLEASTASVIGNVHHGEDLADSSGLTAYMPLDAGFDLHSTWKAPRNFDPLHGYNDTTVAQGTQWEEVFSQISQETPEDAELRKMGLDNNSIVKAKKVIGGTKWVGNQALNLASSVGSWNAQQTARGKELGNYFGLPPSVTVPVAAVGGATTAIKSGKQVLDSINDEELVNKKQAVISGSLGTTQGLGILASATGLLVAKASFLAKPAAMVALGSSIAKTATDLYATASSFTKKKDAAVSSTPDVRTQQAESTESEHYYTPPVAKWLTGFASAGDMDMSKANDQ